VTADLLHGLTLGDVLAEHARSHPGATAVVCEGHRATYPELDARVDRLARGLAGLGVGPGGRVLWLGQNCHRLLEGLLAAGRLGAAFCPVNWRQSADELAFVIDDVQPAVVLWQQQEIGDAVAKARAASGSVVPWIQHDGGEYEELVAASAGGDVGVEVDPSSPVLQMYTAAFGGRPNGALLSHTALLAQGLVVGMLQDVTRDYVYLNCGPLFHIATFMSTLATFRFGATNVFTRRVDAAELCRLIEAERCNGAFVIGPTMTQLLDVNRDGRHDLSSLRTGGGPPAWRAMTSPDTSPWGRRPAGYGQTEVTGLVTFNCLGDPPAGSHGRASPLARVAILDPDGGEVAAGEVGEIAVRGPTVMNGYHRRPELNAERQAGGWHHTGDLGRREADGSISFLGPRLRMVKSAHENIYPAEVEAALVRHPAVREAAVIGVPDPVWEQSVKALVVLEDGASVTAEELIEHCRGLIASYKKPRIVETVDAIPRVGPFPDYDALDAAHGGGGYPGARKVST
jgi:acyl-CoA synthetase (AMP-forming)/AMP-acid ligase II